MAETTQNSRIHRLLHRASRAISEGLAPARLHGVTRLGRRARVAGAPYIENFGTITIGDDFRLASTLEVRSHLVTGRGGLILVGDRVSIGVGAAITARMRVLIGNGAQIGSHALIMDTDFHDIDDMEADSPAAPVVLEDDVRIDPRVTILKGVRIGKGAWIAAGSVVSRDIPAGAFAAGVPARVER